jgi:hypothetical protein
MKTYFLLSFMSVLGCAVSGCNLNLGCSAVGCPNGADDSMSVAFPGLATKHAGALPLTIKACVDGGSCVTAEVTAEGNKIVCKVQGNLSSGTCGADVVNGDVSLVSVLDAATGAKATVTVSVTVTDSASVKVLDDSKSAPLSGNAPNGPGCEPVCHDGAVSFTEKS